MQADIQGRAELRMDEVFGGIKLLIPQSWTVRNEIDGVFHGVEDKRNAYGSVVTDENKVLVLSGSAVFAGIEIKSY
jgi:flagellar basal body rod protein FlgF